MDCEQEYNDYYNACQENWNEQQATFNEEKIMSNAVNDAWWERDTRNTMTI